MKNSIYILLVSSVSIMLNSCIDEVTPDPVPTTPTKMNISDGFITQDTMITLKAGGSIVKDDASIKYDYYFSADNSNFEKVNPENIELQPYTQYWWYAVPNSYYGKDLVATGERTETRTFYCIPPFDIESDNGEGDWAAIIRFKNVDNIVGGKVTAISDYGSFEVEIPAGQDSCYIKYERYFESGSEPDNNAYVHWWDDAHGVYYEPIIYTFKVDLTLRAGDKDTTYTKSIKEIILDKNDAVRDHEFNVYRVVKIGNRQWLADDLRTKSFIYKGDTIKLDDVKVSGKLSPSPYKTVKLPESGSTGIIYCTGYSQYSKVSFSDSKGNSCSLPIYYYISLLAPKGFHISDNDDWEDLEMFYAVDTPKVTSVYGYYPIEYFSEDNYEELRKENTKKFQGANQGIRRLLSSMYDWKYYNNEETAIGMQTQFNAKPFVGEGRGCIYYTLKDEEQRCDLGLFRLLSTVDKGILNWGCYFGYNGEKQVHYQYVSLRCVKD